jgi:alpha-D-glucose phosphate-specific phosphoglucomutase
MSKIKFGTDGWRATVAEDFTFENVRLVSQAYAEHLMAEGYANRGVVIGYDTRFASDRFAIAAAEVYAGNGIKVHISETFVPTPALSYSIIDKKVGGGIMITASHNPYTDNGYKVKPYYGGSASPEIVTDIENRVEGAKVRRMPFDIALEKGVVEVFDPSEAYFEQLGRMVDLDNLRNSPIDLIVDPMYGAGQDYYPRIFGYTGRATVSQIHGVINPMFPGMHNPEPIAKNLGELMELIASAGTIELGIANDGDADRVGIVDEKGNFINQLQVMALLTLYMLEIKKERGMIVKSLSTTSMCEKLGKLYDVPVFETPVGFKYIGPKMMAENAMIGGEESGGFAFSGHIPERDGILAGLFIADMHVRTGKSISGLIDWLYEKVGAHYYDRVDFTFDQSKRAEIMQRIKDNTPKELAGKKVVNARYDDGFKYYSEDGSWLLIRFSGTEPIMRVYTETTSEAAVASILEQGRALTGVK